ncbi:MAG: GspH/FimT family pseudopilin [Gammaproteobacteria bacterium]
MKDTLSEYRRRQRGLTLIELLIAVGVVAVLLALAVPSFSGLIERKRLEGATEKMVADFQFARSEAIKRNTEIFISFDEGDQCYGLATVTGCDCSASPTTCQIDGVDRVTFMSDFGETEFDQNFSGNETSYDPRRGAVSGGLGTVEFSSPGGMETRVVLSLLRILVCSPAGATKNFNYKDC